MIKVRSYFQQKKISARLSGKKDFENVVKRTAECLGISERTVKRVSKEAANSEELRESHQKEGRPPIYVDDFLIGVIRRKLFDFYMEKTFPSVEKLLKKLIEDVPDFPKISTMTLWRILKKNNFSYKKLQKKPILMESKTVSHKRRQFLDSIKSYRELGWNIYFLDETWCGANHTLSTGWDEHISGEVAENYDIYRSGVQTIGNCRGGFVILCGAGKRVIILHIGNENGFVDTCMKFFIGKKGSADYHDEMNAFRGMVSACPDCVA